MSRVAFGSVIGGAGALLALVLIVMISGDAGATAPPAGFDIYATGIDMDPSSPSANTATTIGGGGAGIDDGDLQAQSGNVALDAEICIDVVVDEVPNGGTPSGGAGIFGPAMVVNWDPAVAGIVGYRAGDKNVGVVASCLGGGDQEDFLYSMADDEGALSQTNSAPNPSGATPNTTGAFEINNVWSDATETGPGLLAQFTFRCLTAGSTAITLTGQDIGEGPKDTVQVQFAGDPIGGQYTVANEFEATLFCGTAPTVTASPPPTTAPATTTAPGTTAPGTTAPGTTAPGTTAPGTTAPGTTAPGTTAPATTAPGTTAPGTTPATQTVLWGDWDCDGEISTRDNQALLRNVLQQAALSQTEPCPDLGTQAGDNLWGDSDCDGEISTRDNQALLRKVLSQAALSQTEPCPDLGTSTEI
jgi:hypothetical protein